MANSASAKGIRFYKYLLDLRLHFCPRSYASRGTREFIDTYLADVREANPGFPIFLIPHYDVEPWLYARYKFGRKSKIRLSNLTVHQVLCVVEEVSQGGFWMGTYLQKPTHAPRAFQLLPKEIKSRNPFEVLSKLQ
uniref:NADH dehydrogenase [ubiquinone] 1 alpha subcomplex subunit 2 n=1 Tax=Trichuris muris TaxID=70415 RepID=A0A5S6QXD6_TRIMR